MNEYKEHLVWVVHLQQIFLRWCVRFLQKKLISADNPLPISRTSCRRDVCSKQKYKYIRYEQCFCTHLILSRCTQFSVEKNRAKHWIPGTVVYLKIFLTKCFAYFSQEHWAQKQHNTWYKVWFRKEVWKTEEKKLLGSTFKQDFAIYNAEKKKVLIFSLNGMNSIWHRQINNSSYFHLEKIGRW